MFLPLLVALSFSLYPAPYGNVTPTVLLQIAQCESGQQQFNPDGSVLHGIANHNDIGYFQINTTYNAAAAKKLGYDIYTEKGNIEYALYLYHQKGTQPWNASKNCWGNAKAA